MEQTQPGKVFDWTNEADRKAYQEQVEKDKINNRLYPPQNRRSRRIRQWFREHPEIQPGEDNQ